MKVRSDFILRQVTDTYVVLPLGEAITRLDGMITLNESGVFLWLLLEKDAQVADLVRGLTEQYDVSAEDAHADVLDFLDILRTTGCLEE